MHRGPVGSVEGATVWRALVVVVMVVLTLVALPGRSDAASSAIVTASPAGAAELAQARRTGARVAVPALSSATTKVFALPSGQFRAAITPVRLPARGSVTWGRLPIDWTAVWRKQPERSFWQNEQALGAGFGGPKRDIVRSYFRFDTRVFRGKRILDAELNLRQIDAASCTAHRTYVFRTGNVTAKTTWKRQPIRYASQSYNTSTTGCGADKGMVGWDVTEAATTLAATGATTGTFLVRAQNELDPRAWKRYDDDYASFYVTYVSEPDVPTSVDIRAGSAGYSCGTAAEPTVVGSTDVRLRAVLTTPDVMAGSITGVFQRRDLALEAEEPEVEGTSVSSGMTSERYWAVEDGHVYRFRVKNRATWTHNGVPASWDSAYADWCYFRVDL